MTDGLGAAIRAKLALFHSEPCLSNEGCNTWGFDEMHAALLAVLDRHKPASNESWAPGTREVRTVCGECSPGEDDHYDQPYPCPTVRAIAKELGVEAT